MNWWKMAEKLSAVCLGERIIDEYVYVTPAGKSAKENVIAYVREGTERWEGGIGAVAGHLQQVVASVALTSGGLEPVVKRRFVHKPFMAKVFQEVELPAAGKTVWPEMKGDFGVVADFGHGLFGPTWWHGWFALTCQSNSLNWGFNPVTKWKGRGASYIVVDLYEAQLALQERVPAEDAVRKLQALMEADTVAVTMGHQGAVLVRGKEMVWVGAKSKHPVDRMGAGDAFLAWSAPFAYLGAPLKVIGNIGAAAAAVKVETPGNGRVSREAVLERLAQS